MRHLDRFVSLHPKALRGDDVEAIHDIRVASRRTQQVVDLLYPKPRPKAVRKLRRKVRRCRGALSEVRNCDVLLAVAERTLRRKRLARRRAWTAVRDYLSEKRAGSFEEATEELIKIKFGALYVGLKGAIDSGPARSDAQAGPVVAGGAPAFSGGVAESLQSLWQEFETQVLESHRQPESQKLHGVRIAAKQLRYLVEVLAELGAEGSAEALGWLKRLQEHLGDWHDLEVLEQAMAETIARPKFLRRRLEQAIEIEKLMLHNRRRKRRFEDRYFQMTMDTPEWKRLNEWARRMVSSPETMLAQT
ncbi:MAG: CHAD domain-containing protein [Acidobacteria bacterium]|nr:CHAD domain-containing protein [Acidobacteriota bacterium]